MGSRPTRKLALLAALGLGLSVSATLALREGQPKQTGNGFDVLRLPNNIADGAHIADEHGFFAENRIRIEWTGKQLHGPASIVSLVAGQNDAAGSISTAMIIARNNGSKLKIIAASSTSTQESPGHRYLVKDGSPITGKPEDFLGKKVVANPTTISWYPIVMLLKRAGLDYRKVQFVALPSPLAVEQALRAGEVDVISGTERTPPGSKLLAEGGVHFIPGVSDFEVLGIEQIGGWVMRDDYIEEHPDVVRRFIASLTQAHRWANAHPVEAKALLNRRMEVPKAYHKFQGVWRDAPETALVDEASIRKWLSILEEFGQIAPGAVKAEDVFTNAYNPYVSQPSFAAGAALAR